MRKKETAMPEAKDELTGRVALVAGGSGGIGAATAQRLAAAGAIVWVGYNRGADKANEIVKRIAGQGHRAVHLPMEDSAAIKSAIAGIEQAHGRLDILINSAGFTRAVPHAELDALDDATIDAVLTANVRGPFATIRASAPLMRKTGDAVIVNLSSISGFTGSGSSIIYCASKAALDTMSKSLARVLGPEIRVLTVSPAAVDTDFVPGRTRAAIERQAAGTPLKKVQGPDDVALAIMACVTHLRFSTGAIIVSDGGNHLR
jgi:3-oxoacyl-[acyl-carrier protein] reductase